MRSLGAATIQGLAWPSLRTLAAVTGYGINAVKEARRKLLAIGLIEPVEQERLGGRFGLKRFRAFTVARKQAHGTVASSTVARSTVARKQCQEGSPSEGFGFPRENPPREGNQVDAVRRRFDAELHPSTDDDLVSKAKPKTSFETKPNPTAPGKAKLQSRIEARIKKNKECFADWVDSELSKGRPHPFGASEKRAFTELGYPINIRSADVSWDFVFIACDVCDENRGKGISPGNLCSKVIDAIAKERKSDVKNGGDGGGHYWPLDFQKHRNALRAQERLAEKATQASDTGKLRLSREEAQRWVDRNDATWVDDRKESLNLTPSGIDRRARMNQGADTCA